MHTHAHAQAHTHTHTPVQTSGAETVLGEPNGGTFWRMALNRREEGPRPF
jgi:hypothetical protein